MCKHSHSTHAPSPPSGGAFGALLCRKEFLLNCSSHSPQIIDLRPRSCGATVLLSATFSGNGCACCRAGFGSKEQRLLQTPDLVVLLISYLLKCSYCRCVCLFFPLCGSFSSKLPLTYLAKKKMKLGTFSLLLFIEGTLPDYFSLVWITQRGVMRRVLGPGVREVACWSCTVNPSLKKPCPFYPSLLCPYSSLCWECPSHSWLLSKLLVFQDPAQVSLSEKSFLCLFSAPHPSPCCSTKLG